MNLTSREERLIESIVSENSACKPCNWCGRFCFWLMAIGIPIMILLFIVRGVTGYMEYEAVAREHGGCPIMERLAAEDRHPTREEWEMLELSRKFGFDFASAIGFAFFYWLGFVIWRQQRLIVKLAGLVCVMYTPKSDTG